MATRDTNFWKIGLFVILAMATALGTLFYLGAARLAREPVDRVTYFDESVQGLEVGAPLKMRGVTIGKVTDITIAPDRRLVQVTSDVYVDVMVRLNLGTAVQLRNYTAPIPDDLRVQLGSTGLTGVKFLLVDFFPDAAPPPTLSFDPHRGYVPSTPSTLKSLEDSFFGLANSMPETLAAFADLARTIERKVTVLDMGAIQEQLLALLADVDALARRMDTSLAELDVKTLSAQLSEDLVALNGAILKADGLLEQLASSEGPLNSMAADISALTARTDELLVSAQTALEGADLPATTASVRGTVDAFGALAGDGGVLVAQLQDTLLLLGESLAAVKSLASAIERQPGAFIAGRTPDSPRPKPDDR